MKLRHVPSAALHAGDAVVAAVRVVEHVRQHARAVEPLPHEQVVRERVPLRPAELHREEPLDARADQQLRQRGGEAEAVREPADGVFGPESSLEIALSVEELAGQRLAGGHHAVRLDPHAADRLEARLGDQALEQLGVVLLEPGEHLRGRLVEVELRVALQHPGHRGERPLRLAARLVQRPAPREIQVRVPRDQQLAGGRVQLGHGGQLAVQHVVRLGDRCAGVVVEARRRRRRALRAAPRRSAGPACPRCAPRRAASRSASAAPSAPPRRPPRPRPRPRRARASAAAAAAPAPGRPTRGGPRRASPPGWASRTAAARRSPRRVRTAARAPGAHGAARRRRTARRSSAVRGPRRRCRARAASRPPATVGATSGCSKRCTPWRSGHGSPSAIGAPSKVHASRSCQARRRHGASSAIRTASHSSRRLTAAPRGRRASPPGTRPCAGGRACRTPCAGRGCRARRA